MSGSDDLGELGDLDDGEDGLGGLDDGGDFDDFDEMDGGEEAVGGGGGNVDELEHRLDELENEVGSLSSTVNTVRNENEQISESVEEVEENVRKLLDIYEMVTRGVNPFADEMDAGMGMGGGQMDSQDGSFGLFTDDEQEEEESVDEDITDADAEGFFDDDLVEEDDDGMDEEIDADVDDVFDDESVDDDTDEFDDGGDDGFDNIAGEEFDDVTEDAFDEAGEDAFDDGKEAFREGGEASAVTAEDDGLGDDDLFDETIDGTVDGTAGEESSVQEDRADVGTEQETATTESASTADEGKPYLRSIPDGLANDLIVVEWVEFLVGEVGIRGASEAINYYETIDWVTEEAASALESHLNTFEPGRRGSLTISHHKQSLEYIDQLNGGEAGQQQVSGFERGGPL